jgi:hypothetical protein
MMWIAFHLAAFLVSAAVGTWTTNLEEHPQFVHVARSAYDEICESYPARLPDSTSCETMLHLCPEGLVYSSSGSTHSGSNAQDPRLVPWDRIIHWQIEKPPVGSSQSETSGQSALQITESRGLFLARDEHRFTLCGADHEDNVLRESLRANTEFRP